MELSRVGRKAQGGNFVREKCSFESIARDSQREQVYRIDNLS